MVQATSIKINYTNPALFCDYSKEKIHIGEMYITFYENYHGDLIEKYYKMEYKDFIDEE